jgi:hypothetical protein
MAEVDISLLELFLMKIFLLENRNLAALLTSERKEAE